MNRDLFDFSVYLSRSESEPSWMTSIFLPPFLGEYLFKMVGLRGSGSLVVFPRGPTVSFGPTCLDPDLLDSVTSGLFDLWISFPDGVMSC